MLAAAVLVTPLPLAAQAAWPNRPVRLVVHYAASGGTDILARAIAEELRPSLPHPIIVENRAGAGCPIRCWWSATVRRASSARSRSASRGRSASAA
jgi:tripartite-type tricarboxylate transporter receptor subunit TctC